MLEPVVIATRPIVPVAGRITVCMPLVGVVRTRGGSRCDAERGSITRAGRTVYIGEAWFPMAVGLIAAAGRLVTRDDFLEALFGDREDGGPDDATKMMDVYLCRMRPVLERLDIAIDTIWGRGWCARDAAAPALVPQKRSRAA